MRKSCLVCSCEGTIPVDREALEKGGGTGRFRFVRSLCRDDLPTLQDAIEAGDDVLVACTQEAKLFDEIQDDILAEAAAQATPIAKINIRERAGWTALATDKTSKANLTAKMAALIATADADLPSPPTVRMRSNGALWILGRDETALDAAKTLADRLDVTVLMEPGPGVVAPRRTDYPVYGGHVVRARGHFGAFEIEIKGMRAASPSSRGNLEFTGVPQDGSGVADLILDLRGEGSLFPAPEKRDGYHCVDPKSPVAVRDAMLALTELVGEFEKPRYIAYDRNICAHSRSTIVGCSKCVDNCPTGAVTDDGDGVRYDPYVCAGCGTCTGACPTGAAHYGAPDANADIKRLRILMRAYMEAGGNTPLPLFHDAGFGAEALDMIARFGDGLPAHVLPLELTHVTQLGLDAFLAAFAFGAREVLVLAAPDDTHGRAVLDDQIALATAVAEGLGYKSCGVTVIDETDPDAIASRILDAGAPDALKAAAFEPLGRKRAIMRLALDHLHANAPAPVDEIALPAGAPFGAVINDKEKCTLCMSCVGACPSGAMRDNPDAPQLSFVEDACVQCGLCAKTCPEGALTLQPRLSFADDVRSARILNEDEPFHCIKCGKAYTTQSTADRLIARLRGHSMFTSPAALERLRMCDNCRIIDMTEADDSPFAMGTVPRTRTTADYLAGTVTEDDDVA